MGPPLGTEVRGSSDLEAPLEPLNGQTEDALSAVLSTEGRVVGPCCEKLEPTGPTEAVVPFVTLELFVEGPSTRGPPTGRIMASSPPRPAGVCECVSVRVRECVSV